MTTATAQTAANIAFIKFTLAKLGRSNCKGDSVSKDVGGWTFRPGNKLNVFSFFENLSSQSFLQSPHWFVTSAGLLTSAWEEAQASRHVPMAKE